MHLFDPEVNFAGSGIIAEGCPPAVGAALAAKKRGEDSVAVAYLGDGAISQGGFLESLNLASVHDLPVLFVIEDNDWAISMPKGRVSDVENGAQRAGGFDLPGVRVDYDDAVAVYEAAGEAVGRARDGNGPTLLEVQVHRRMGHFMGDAEGYRPDTDTERAKQLDSITRMEKTLQKAGIDDATIEDIRDRGHERVKEAIEWAKDQPEPDSTEAYEDVFTNSPAGWNPKPESAEATGGDD